MDSLSPLYLESVKYLEKKGKIQAIFSNEKEKFCYVEDFLPYIIADSEILKREIAEFLEEKFSIKILGNKIYARKFSELIKVGNLITKMFSKQPLLIEAERQFLINKNWTYFEEFNKDLEPQKKFFYNSELDSKIVTTSFMLKTDIKNASRIAENEFLIMETFLENEFFKNGFGLCNIQQGIPIYNMRFWNKELYSKIKNENLSPDVICCSCCKSNVVSKSSIATVEILKECCYVIDPHSHSFAKKFHFSNKNQKSRLKMRRDFWLKKFPLGPFEKGEKVKLLLGDALKLEKEGNGRIVNIEKIWFCKKKEGILVKILKELMLKRKELIKERKLMKSISINKAGVFCENLLQKNEKYLMLNGIINFIDRIIFLLPLHICCKDSKFYNETIAYELGL